MNKNWKEKSIFKLVYALYSFIENVKYQRKRCMLCNVHVLRTRSSTWRPPREPDTTTIILHPYGDLLWGMVFSLGSRRGTGIYPRTVIPVISPTNVTLQILSGHRAPWFVASSHWRSRWIVNTGTRPILQRFHRFSPGSPFFSPPNRIQISRAVIFLSSISLFLYLFFFYTSRDVDC